MGDEMGKHGQFAIIPARALDDVRFDKKDKHLRALLALGTFADKNGKCWPSLNTIGDQISAARSTVSGIFKDLAEWGYIKVSKVRREDGGWSSNIYRIVHDAELPIQFDRTLAEHPIQETSTTGEQAIQQPCGDAEHPIQDSYGENDMNVPLNVPLNDGESKTDSPSTAEKTPPVEKAIVLDKASVQEHGTSSDALFDAMHSQSEGMPPLGELTAGVADPQIAEKEYVKRLAPMLASVFGRKVITEDRQAARRAFGLHLNPEFVERRVIAYRNGEGEDFRKADATAFWVVSRLEKDMAMGIGARRVIKVSA